MAVRSLNRPCLSGSTSVPLRSRKTARRCIGEGLLLDQFPSEGFEPRRDFVDRYARGIEHVEMQRVGLAAEIRGPIVHAFGRELWLLSRTGEPQRSDFRRAIEQHDTHRAWRRIGSGIEDEAWPCLAVENRYPDVIGQAAQPCKPFGRSE